ncbi:MAG TPA: polysaccharide pyruvyl transferase family protein [Candidatus Binatia bacterium]|nr:polysaccharide pyruvyl transferase family protein [Candidatus Binatia bacterium]
MSALIVGFEALLRRHLPGTVPRYLQLISGEEMSRTLPAPLRDEFLGRQRLPVTMEGARDRLHQLHEADAVVYLGDFTHMAFHQRVVAARLVAQHLVESPAQAEALTARFHFLVDAPDAALARVVVLGGTLQFDRLRDEFDAVHQQRLRRLVTGAADVTMRDPESALRVAELRSDFERSFLGVDNATLLQREDAAALPRSAWTANPDAGRGCIGLFFGRASRPLERLRDCAADLARALQCGVHWLPWGMSRGYHELAYRVLPPPEVRGLPEDGQYPLPGDLYELLGRYRCVLTDTYHVAVVAWSLGVPAVCIAHSRSDLGVDVSCGPLFAWRDKRQTFYSSCQALDFFVHAVELDTPEAWSARLAHLVRVLGDARFTDAVAGRVRRHAEAAGQRAAAALRRCFALSA